VAAIGGYYLWTRHGSPTSSSPMAKPSIDILIARFAYSSDEFGFLAVNRENSPATISEVYLEEGGKSGGYYSVSAYLEEEGGKSGSTVSVTLEPRETQWIVVNHRFAIADNVWGGEIIVKLFDPTGKILYENNNLHFDWCYDYED
jgi:hypothetical protein